MKHIIQVGAWTFEPKLWTARRVGEDGEFGDGYDGVCNIHQIKSVAILEAMLLQEEDFTRKDWRDFAKFCKLKGLDHDFDRARDLETT